MYALGKEGGPVRQFVSAGDEAEALTHSQPGEIAVAFTGAIVTGGQIQSGAVVFPAPSATALLAKQWQAVRDKRDYLLKLYAWTVDVRTSPLSAACQDQWVAWFAAMNRITINYSDPAQVVWPIEPAPAY